MSDVVVSTFDHGGARIGTAEVSREEAAHLAVVLCGGGSPEVALIRIEPAVGGGS